MKSRKGNTLTNYLWGIAEADAGITFKHHKDAYRKKSNNDSVLPGSGTVYMYINVRHFKIRIQRET
jgi:hypothetical protein